MIGLLLLLLVLRHTNWPSENWPHYTQQRVGYDTKTLRGQRSFETIQISHHIFSFFYSLLFHGVLRAFPFLHRLSFCFLVFLFSSLVSFVASLPISVPWFICFHFLPEYAQRRLRKCCVLCVFLAIKSVNLFFHLSLKKSLFPPFLSSKGSDTRRETFAYNIK